MTIIKTLIEQPIIQTLGWAFLYFIWQGTLLAVMLAGLMIVLRHNSANLRYAISCITMFMMLVLPIVTMYMINESFPKPVFTESKNVEKVFVVDKELQRTVDMTETLSRDNKSFPITSFLNSWRERAFDFFNTFLPWLLSIWLVGVIILFLRLLGGLAYVQRIRKQSVRPADEMWQKTLEHLLKRFNINRPVRLFESALVQVPTVAGWMRPTILLPISAVVGLNPKQVETILAHELAHIRRHDFLINLFQAVIETLLFFHPVVWWVSHRIRVEREHSCDDFAVSACGDVLTYAQTLTELEQLRGAVPQFSLAANGGTLLERIRRLLEIPPVHSNRSVLWLAGVIIIATIFTLGAGTRMSEKMFQVPGVSKKFIDIEREKSLDEIEISYSSTKMKFEWGNGEKYLQMRSEGNIELNDNGTSIRSISLNGYFLIEEKIQSISRKIEIVPKSDGSLEYSFIVDGELREFNEDAQMWLSEILQELNHKPELNFETRKYLSRNK